MSKRNYPDARHRRPANAGSKLPPEPLTRDECMALLRVCSRRGSSGLRNRALLALLYRSGLRIGEALALRTVDVDARAGTVRVLHGKGDKARTVGVDPDALAMLDAWLERRKKLDIKRTAPLFCTLDGGEIAQPYIRAMLKRIAKKAGIEKRVHAHGFRHTHAAELAQENTPVNVISRQLGHASVATTARYLDHVAPAEVIARMRQRGGWAAGMVAAPAPTVVAPPVRPLPVPQPEGVHRPAARVRARG